MIGFKCPLAYTTGQPFFFIGRKDGIETKWMMYEAEEGNNIDTIYEKETTERNGVKVIVPLKNYSDAATFSKKIREQLSYFKGIFVVDEYRTFNNDFQIFENNLFSWSEIQNDNYVHISLGQVYYPIEFSKLGISSINIPIALNIGLNDGIEPVLSREAITYTPHAKEVILNKIKEVANYFITKYNENTLEKETFFEAYPFIGMASKRATLAEKQFTIDSILKYGNVPINELKVKDITESELLFYKRCDYFFPNYNVIIDNKYNAWKTKHIGYYSVKDYLLDKERKIVVVNKFPERKTKSFFQEKYEDDVIFVKESPLFFIRKIKNIKKYDILNTKEKIKEFLFIEEQLKEQFIYELNVENTQEFINWDEKRKEKQKEERRLNIQSGIYESKSLNKAEGDVTIHYAVKSTSRINTFYSFEPSVHPIKTLHKQPYLTILFDKEEKDFAKSFVTALPKTSKIKIALIGKRERTKISNIHNFKSLTQMLTEGHKKFRQIITAGLINELLIDVNVIKNTEALSPYLNKISEKYKLLLSYKIEHNLNLNGELWDSLKALAKEQNLFDHSIYNDYLSVKEEVDLLDFVSLLKEPTYRDTSIEKEKRSKVITRFILFGKKYKNAWDNFELIEKKIEEPVLELQF